MRVFSILLAVVFLLAVGYLGAWSLAGYAKNEDICGTIVAMERSSEGTYAVHAQRVDIDELLYVEGLSREVLDGLRAETAYTFSYSRGRLTQIIRGCRV